MSQSKKSFTDYEGFVEKFKTKLTTDDCYTPPAVYDTVLQWLRENADIEGREIVRPFYPGGDFENFDYPEGCVVVDNPPFSIYSKIVRFYMARGIRFFLFAPALSTFISGADCSFVITRVHIIYENGARVPTNFVTNLIEPRVWLCGELLRRITETQEKKKSPRKKILPDTVQSSARLGAYVEFGTDFKIMRNESTAPRSGIKEYNVFGQCILLGRHVADHLRTERERTERERTERERTERERTERERTDFFALSDAESEEVANLTRR